MSATSASRTVNIVYSGALAGEQDLAAADNDSTPAVVELKTLASGANTITVPTGATACTIVLPVANAVLVTLKGVTGDTGVKLHATDPTSIALDATVATFCLTAASSLPGVRLYWS